MRKIKQAMILAAGLGSRMKELTCDIPKPMIQVDGISLIERTLTYLQQHEIEKVVINTYYKAEILENFILSLEITKKLEIIFSREKELLGTGGGIKNALHLFEDKPFFILNSDSIFIDNNENNSSFDQLETKWNLFSDIRMLLVLIEKEKSFGYWDKGDFDLGEENRLNQNNEIRQYIYTGMSLIDYKLFEHLSSESNAFPINFKELMQKDCLRSVIYDGNWYHVGDKQAFEKFTVFKSITN